MKKLRDSTTADYYLIEPEYGNTVVLISIDNKYYLNDTREYKIRKPKEYLEEVISNIDFLELLPISKDDFYDSINENNGDRVLAHLKGSFISDSKKKAKDDEYEIHDYKYQELKKIQKILNNMAQEITYLYRLIQWVDEQEYAEGRDNTRSGSRDYEKFVNKIDEIEDNTNDLQELLDVIIYSTEK